MLKDSLDTILLKESGQEIFMNDPLNNLRPHYPMSTIKPLRAPETNK